MSSIERLRTDITAAAEILRRFSDRQASERSSLERWCIKEVVGHLIDSASNNHQRFVRAQIAGRLEFPRYEQESWVRVQQYANAQWEQLIDLWQSYNTHLLHVVSCMPPEGQRATCRVGDGQELTLSALFEDYVNHLEHHLSKMLGSWPLANGAVQRQSQCSAPAMP